MKYILGFLLLIATTQSLFLPLTSKPLCFYINDEPGKEVYFSYSVNGNNPEKVDAEFNPANLSQQVYHLEG